MDRVEARGRVRLVMSGSWPDPPAGFTVVATGAAALYVAAAAKSELGARGLSEAQGWHRALAAGSLSSGRGNTAIVPGPSGVRWRLKGMRRGGWLAAVWRDRYPSARRLVDTLAASVEAGARGVPTASPVALMVERGPGPLARGAMAFTEIEGAEDLAKRVMRGAFTEAELAPAMGTIRAMHERGVCHPDLNLGNILLRPRAGGGVDTFVIDFDRAAFTSGPLPFERRQAALRRLERSCAKLTGAPGPLGPGSEDLWYTCYAGGDADLSRRLASGRGAGKLSLALHRLGWRRNAG